MYHQMNWGKPAQPLNVIGMWQCFICTKDLLTYRFRIAGTISHIESPVHDHRYHPVEPGNAALVAHPPISSEKEVRTHSYTITDAAAGYDRRR